MNDHESEQTQKEKITSREIIICILAVGMVIFHLSTATTIIVAGFIQSAVHFAFVGCMIVLTKPLKFKGGIIIEGLLLALVVFIAAYQIWLQVFLFENEGVFSTLDLVVSIVCIVLALYLGVRMLGWILPGICILFIAYALFGNNLPGLLTTASFSVKRVFCNLYTATDGVFGTTMMVSARFLLLFIFFGALMDITGAGEFFVNAANSVAGRVRGGPAQAAVFSSMLMGMVNGSGPANVATTGTFTIPLMKKTGYKASVAGAVEAVASTGGQIMPPVMGAVAFLMSETTGIPYTTIAWAALVPAVLYYLTLSVSVYGKARRQRMEKPDPATLPTLFGTLKKGWFYIIPMLVIIIMVFSGKSPQRSALWAIIATFAVALIFDRKRVTFRSLLCSCRDAAITARPLAMACMLAGVIMCVINLTSLGLKLSIIIRLVSHGSLLITLIMAMLAGLLLGMGLPTSAAYIVLAVLVVPSIVTMGVTMLAAHLFILYFGILSGITPPVALSTFTASGISGAGIWETGWEAVRLAAAGFIIPFIFVYNNELLLIGNPINIAVAILTAAIGCTILGFAVSGWCLEDMPAIARILLIPCAISVIVVHPLWLNFVGFFGAVIITMISRLITHARQRKLTT